MDYSELLREAQQDQRKERRTAVLMMLLGLLFAGLGVFLWVIGNDWIALIGVLFGATIICSGFLVSHQASGTTNISVFSIITCLLFAVFGAVLFITGLTSPEDLTIPGGPIRGIVAGILCMAFFGIGAIALIVKKIKSSSHD